MSSQTTPKLLRSSTSSISTATSTTNGGMTTPHQPIGSNKGSDLAGFLKNMNYSPPLKAKGIETASIITATNDVLKPVACDWTQLDDAGKAKMAFLILNNQHELYLQKFPNDLSSRAQAFRMALDESTRRGKHLAAFVRKGGDKNLPSPDVCYYQKFLDMHEEWREATTIFKSDPFQNLEPFIRFQEHESMVCFIISASNMILYYMQMTTGTRRDEAIHQYGINVGRFMRNQLTPEHIFLMVFQGEGGYPVNILENLLQFCQPAKPDKPKVGQLRLESFMSPSRVAAHVSDYLKHRGPLLVENFKTFPEFSKKETTVVHGDWNQLKGQEKHGCHAFLIVGVLETGDDSMGGVKFLVQDSVWERPFINVGWDLLKSMGVNTFSFIEEGVTYVGSSLDHEFDGDNVPVITYSGSPASSASRVPSLVCATQNQPQIMALDSGDSEESEKAKVEAKVALWNSMLLDIPEGTNLDHVAFLT